MAHQHPHNTEGEKLRLGPGASTFVLGGLIVGVLGIVAALALAITGDTGIKRFFFAYLSAWSFFLSLGVGGVFFLLITYVTRSGWAVTVRRVPEALARTFPLLLVLSLPILWTLAENKGTLYRWATPEALLDEHHAEGDAHAPGQADASKGSEHSTTAAHATTEAKGEHAVPSGVTIVGVAGKGVAAPDKPLQYPIDAPELEATGPLVKGKVENPLLLGRWGVITRALVCLTALTAIALWYTSRSRKQDDSGDESITSTLQGRAAPLLVIFGLSVTFLAFDLIMSLDPIWYSTIFGGYFFAGAAISVMATTILVCQFLQSKGYLAGSIRVDHYHDLSKFQFAFTFFWGYLAFSQFMLLWYSSQPEALTWLARRGASTAAMHLQEAGAWTVFTLVLLFGKLLIPFAGLLSRHVKRNPLGRMFFAAWILVFHALDMIWLVMPEMGGFHVGLTELAAFIGLGGLFVAVFVKSLAGVNLRPIKDPRANESLAFHQAF
jgi:hypothetical protein